MTETYDDYLPEHRAAEKGSVLSNKLYDYLKFIALVFLPALGAFYFGLAEVWSLPKADEVVGTIVVLDTFLGVLLGISNSRYNHAVQGPTVGTLKVTETEEGKNMMLNFPGDPNEIDQHDRVTFKVEKT